MNRSTILGYQLLTGASDTATGALLILTPGLALGLLRLRVPSNQFIYLSFIGTFVFSVGLACFYGALVAYRGEGQKELEIVWLLTAITRTSVAMFVAAQVMNGSLDFEWLAVAGFDGMCVLIQAIGLRNGWLASATS